MRVRVHWHLGGKNARCVQAHPSSFCSLCVLQATRSTWHGYCFAHRGAARNLLRGGATRHRASRCAKDVPQVASNANGGPDRRSCSNSVSGEGEHELLQSQLSTSFFLALDVMARTETGAQLRGASRPEYTARERKNAARSAGCRGGDRARAPETRADWTLERLFAAPRCEMGSLVLNCEISGNP